MAGPSRAQDASSRRLGLGACPGRKGGSQQCGGGAVQESSSRGRGSKKHKSGLARTRLLLFSTWSAAEPLATMSVELEEALPLTTADGAAKKAAKAGGSAALSPSKKKKNKKKNQPGKYSQLVVETIRRLGERNGSSLAKIYTEAKKVAWFDQQNGRTYLKYSIKALVQNDTLLQVKGTGANGSFKLNRKKLDGSGERRGVPAAATVPAAAVHKAKKAAPGAAGTRCSDQNPAKSQKPEKRSHKKGVASKDKGGKAKAAAAAGKKVKKAAKPSVPKVPKGRK